MNEKELMRVAYLIQEALRGTRERAATWNVCDN